MITIALQLRTVIMKHVLFHVCACVSVHIIRIVAGMTVID